MMPREGASVDEEERKGEQDGHSGMNALGESAEIVADEDNALLAHQSTQQEDETLHIEARNQRSQFHVDKRGIHVLGTNKFVVVDVERFVGLGKSRFHCLVDKVDHILRFQTEHSLSDFKKMRKDCEVRAIWKRWIYPTDERHSKSLEEVAPRHRSVRQYLLGESDGRIHIDALHHLQLAQPCIPGYGSHLRDMQTVHKQ